MPGIWLSVRLLMVDIIMRAFNSPEVLIGKAFLKDKFGSHFCAVFSWTSLFFLHLLFVILPTPLPTPLPSHPLESSSIIPSTWGPFFSDASWSMPDSSPLCTHVLSAQCFHSAQIFSLQLQWVMIHVSLLFMFLCQWYSYFCLDYKTLGKPCTSNHLSE